MTTKTHMHPRSARKAYEPCCAAVPWETLGRGGNSARDVGSQAVAGSVSSAGHTQPGNDDWRLGEIHVRVQGSVGIAVPVFVSFEVLPEVELVWKRAVQ